MFVYSFVVGRSFLTSFVCFYMCSSFRPKGTLSVPLPLSQCLCVSVDQVIETIIINSLVLCGTHLSVSCCRHYNEVITSTFCIKSIVKNFALISVQFSLTMLSILLKSLYTLILILIPHSYLYFDKMSLNPLLIKYLYLSWNFIFSYHY